MDAALLRTDAFWADARPFAAGVVPDIPELAGHVLFQTSGSSGQPKWVALSKTALLISAAAVNRHLMVTARSRWGLALPLNHVGGFGVVARSYEAGCDLEIFGQRWAAGDFHGWLEAKHISHTTLVPAQVHDLVKADLTCPHYMKAIVVGGGHLDQATGRAARDLGWPVLASYGMTETGSQIATQGLELLDTPYHSSPLPLLPVWKAGITENGLLTVSGAALFSGYVIAGEFVPRSTEWHVTSDRAKLEDNSITPLGRADWIIKILGELVDPEAVEREIIILSEGKIDPRGFAVISVPDERAENALVPLFESAESMASAEHFLSDYNHSSPGFRRLKAAVVAGPFPRSGLGKLLRLDLSNKFR